MRSLYESILDDEDDLLDSFDDKLLMTKIKALCNNKASYPREKHKIDVQETERICKEFWKLRKKISQCKSKYFITFTRVPAWDTTDVEILSKDETGGKVYIYSFYCGNQHILKRSGWYHDTTIKFMDKKPNMYYEIPSKFNKDIEALI